MWNRTQKEIDEALATLVPVTEEMVFSYLNKKIEEWGIPLNFPLKDDERKRLVEQVADVILEAQMRVDDAINRYKHQATVHWDFESTENLLKLMVDGDFDWILKIIKQRYEKETFGIPNYKKCVSGEGQDEIGG